MMNNKILYKEHFREEIENYRKNNKITHEQMAEKLEIVPRSYTDLAKGKYSPSFATMVQYLLVLTDEQILNTMHKLHKKVEEVKRDEFI